MKPLYSIAACAVLLLSSCQQSFYVPDKVNSPGFKRAGEAKFDLSARPQNKYNDGAAFSYSSDLAYAPINHLGIIASYRNINNKETRVKDGSNGLFSDTYSYSTYNGQRGDIGAGYFTRLGRKGKYEAYAGYGNGSLSGHITYDSNIYTAKPPKSFTANLNRFFIQSGIGISNNAFSIMGGLRFTLQKYYNFSSADPKLKYSLIPNTTQDFTKETFGFIEPYFEVQVGYKFVKFNYQIGCPYQVNGFDLERGSGLLYMSFGVVLHYDPGFFLPKKLLGNR